MQKPTNIDYRDFFNFEVCYPLFIDAQANEQKLIGDLLEDNCQIVKILRDKLHPDFLRLEEDMGKEAYEKAVAIFYFVKTTKVSLA